MINLKISVNLILLINNKKIIEKMEVNSKVKVKKNHPSNKLWATSTEEDELYINFN